MAAIYASRFSRGYSHTLPKRNIALNIFGVVLGLRIEPGGVLVRLTARDYVIITCRPLPSANSMRGGGLKIFVNDRSGREIMIAIDNDRFVAFGQNCSIPNCFHIIVYPINRSRTSGVGIMQTSVLPNTR